MEPWIVALVLASALMHATWNAVVKSGGDRLLTLLAIKIPNMIVAAAAMLVFDFPSAASWPYLLGSTLAVTGYYFCLLRAYHENDFNVAYPVARGFAPVLVLLLVLVLTSERITYGSATGVAVVSLGVCGLAYRSHMTQVDLNALLWAMSVGGFIAIYTVIDGLGARLSGDPIGYTAVLNVLAGVPVCVAAFSRHGVRAVRHLRHNFVTSAVGGTLMFAAYAIVVFALSRSPMAPVAALRESSVIFGALIGGLIFREPVAVRRIFSACVVAAGIGILMFQR